MGWSQPSAESRNLAAGIIAALIVAIVGIVFFSGFSDWTKAATVAVLTVIGILNFLALIGTFQRWRQDRWSRRLHRNFRKDPEWVSELARLDKSIYAVLYERSGDHPSLDLQGEQVIKEALGNREGSDFDARVLLLKRGYESIHEEIAKFALLSPRKRNVSEFQQLQREVSRHLDVVEQGFPPVYSAAASTDRITVASRKDWHRFVVQYNDVLAQWKTFVDRLSEQLRVGFPTTAKPAEDLPSSVH
jgi:hypothetical protein